MSTIEQLLERTVKEKTKDYIIDETKNIVSYWLLDKYPCITKSGHIHNDVLENLRKKGFLVESVEIPASMFESYTQYNICKEKTYQ